jgi:hypothetical protein
MILKIFPPKKFKTKSTNGKFYHIVGFEKNAIFSAENCQK